MSYLVQPMTNARSAQILFDPLKKAHTPNVWNFRHTVNYKFSSGTHFRTFDSIPSTCVTHSVFCTRNFKTKVRMQSLVLLHPKTAPLSRPFFCCLRTADFFSNGPPFDHQPFQSMIFCTGSQKTVNSIAIWHRVYFQTHCNTSQSL